MLGILLFLAKPEESFVNERVYLTRAHFWSPETGHDETASIAINDAIIVDIQYDGFDDYDGAIDHADHFYTGILSFKTPDGRLHYMNRGISFLLLMHSCENRNKEPSPIAVCGQLLHFWEIHTVA